MVSRNATRDKRILQAAGETHCARASADAGSSAVIGPRLGFKGMKKITREAEKPLHARRVVAACLSACRVADRTDSPRCLSRVAA
jgi:hypothetical protein